MADSSMMSHIWERTVKTMTGRTDLPVVLVVAAGMILLLVLAAVSVAHRRREREAETTAAFPPGKRSLRLLCGMLWALPVLGVLMLFGGQAHSVYSDYVQAARHQREAAAVSDPPGLQFVSRQELPLWVRSPEQGHWVLTARGATVNEAEKHLAARLRHLLENRYPEFQWVPSLPMEPESLKRHLVVRQSIRRGEEIVRDFHHDAAEVFWEIDVTPQRLAEVREEMLWPRIWMMGNATLLVVLLVLVATLYLRLDTHTAGQYRGRLKLAAISLVIVFGTLLSAWQKPV